MKKSALAFLLCVVLGSSVNAQKFSLLPQIGLETSKALINFNNLPAFSPNAQQLSPRLGLRMDYAFKQGHGPYVGVGTTRTAVAVNLSEPSSGMNIAKTTPGSMQLRLEAGYQISSKPIYFNKPTAVKAPPKMVVEKVIVKSRCGGYATRYITSFQASTAAVPTNKGWFVTVQPSAGLAMVPAVKTSVTTQLQGNKTSVTYLAGNMSSAFITGAGFNFGENTQKKFSINIQYFKGLGNLDTREVATSSGSKTTVTNLGSSVSGWNFSVGIPLSLVKKKAVVKPPVIIQEQPKKVQSHRRCGQYSSSVRYL